MKSASMLNSPAPLESLERRVVRRTRGAPHGPVTRLFGPQDLGGRLKPFVLLDYVDLTPTGELPRTRCTPERTRESGARP
jgi:hypothetical protein